MPSITFDINQLTEEQKEQFVEKFTNSASKNHWKSKGIILCIHK